MKILLTIFFLAWPAASTTTEDCIDTATRIVTCLAGVAENNQLFFAFNGISMGSNDEMCSKNCVPAAEIAKFMGGECVAFIEEVTSHLAEICTEEGSGSGYCDVLWNLEMYQMLCNCEEGRNDVSCQTGEDQWHSWYGDDEEDGWDWEDEDWEEWEDEWGEDHEGGDDAEMDCPNDAYQLSVATIGCLAESWNSESEDFDCEKECQTRAFLHHPECFIEAKVVWGRGFEDMMSAVLYYYKECETRDEETDIENDCVEGSRETYQSQLIMVDKGQHCPKGYGFPTSQEQCQKALLTSNRITEESLSEDLEYTIYTEPGHDPADARPRCFWHGDGVTAPYATAGYFASPSVSCEWKIRGNDFWDDYGAVCVLCGGCFGDCWDCEDGLDRENANTKRNDREKRKFDDDGHNHDHHQDDHGDGNGWNGLIALLIICCFMLALCYLAIGCFKSSQQKVFVHSAPQNQQGNMNNDIQLVQVAAAGTQLRRPTLETAQWGPMSLAHGNEVVLGGERGGEMQQMQQLQQLQQMQRQMPTMAAAAPAAQANRGDYAVAKATMLQ